MADPTPAVAFIAPSGIPLRDGYSTRIVFSDPSAAGGIGLWEATVQPPGLDGGDAVEQTTMVNTKYRTFRPRQLLTLNDMSGTAAYDPNIYNELEDLINVEQTITVFFPDGSTLAFYGYLRSVAPEENVEGTQPRVAYTITPTNWDYVNGIEAGPALASVGSV